MRVATLSIAGIILLAGIGAASQSPRTDGPRTIDRGAAAKPAWEWTDEERLAKRFDPVARKLRVDAAMARRHRDSAPGREIRSDAAQNDSRPDDVIQGSSDPELLMPSEIYTTFMRVAYAYEDEAAREFRRDASVKALELGLPEDFLLIVERESEQFLRLQRRQVELQSRMDGGGGYEDSIPLEIKNLQSALCPARAAAILRLRQRFGAAVFNRFLYSAVAPGVFFTFLEPPPAAATLRSQEEGCK
jgi:hypothetical protein